MTPSKYILHLIDTNNPEQCELSIYLDDCSNDVEAISEADAQLELMTSLGGIPYTERWANVEGCLMKDGTKIWSDAVIMEY